MNGLVFEAWDCLLLVFYISSFVHFMKLPSCSSVWKINSSTIMFFEDFLYLSCIIVLTNIGYKVWFYLWVAFAYVWNLVRLMVPTQFWMVGNSLIAYFSFCSWIFIEVLLVFVHLRLHLVLLLLLGAYDWGFSFVWRGLSFSVLW